MSNVLLNRAWPLVMSSTEKLVLIALADAARDPDDDSHPCQTWISMNGRADRQGLVQRTCLTDRAIRMAIGELVEAGHITRDEKPGRGVLYTVHPGMTFPRNVIPGEDASARNEDAGTPEGGSAKSSVTINHRKLPAAARIGKPLPPPVLNPDWTLPEDWKEWTGTRMGWSLPRIEAEAEKFADYWRQNAHRKAARKSDWQAAWRAWCRNSERFNHDRASASPARGSGGTVVPLNALAAAAARVVSRGGGG